MSTKIKSESIDSSGPLTSSYSSANEQQLPAMSTSYESFLCETTEQHTSTVTHDSTITVDDEQLFLHTTSVCVTAASCDYQLENKPMVCTLLKTAALVDYQTNEFVSNSSPSAAVTVGLFLKCEENSVDNQLLVTERHDSVQVDVKPRTFKMNFDLGAADSDSSLRYDDVSEEEATQEQSDCTTTPLEAAVISLQESVVSTANWFIDQSCCTVSQNSRHQLQSDASEWLSNSDNIRANDMSLLLSNVLDQVLAEHSSNYFDCTTSADTDCTGSHTISTENNDSGHEDKKFLSAELDMLEESLRQSSFESDLSHGLSLEQLKMFNIGNMSSPQKLIFSCTKAMFSARASIQAHKKTCNYDPISCGETPSCQNHHRVNVKCVIKDLVSSKLVSLHYGYKTNHVMIVLPTELRLLSEMDQYISAEGIPMFLKKQSMSHIKYFRLLSLAQKMCEVEDVKGTSDSALCWYQNRRRRTLASVCCTSDEHIRQLKLTIKRKLKLYR